MGCDREQECLLYLWGEMDEGQSRDFSLHLQQCPVCKGQVEAFEPLVRSMQSVAIKELPEEVAQRISGRLAKVGERRARRVRFGPQRVVAVAASIILVVGIGLLWQRAVNRPAEPGTPGGQEIELLLSDDDYVEALALVLINEPSDPDDILSQAIEDVGYQIEMLSKEIEEQLGPMEPNKGGPAEQGSNPAAVKVRST